MFLVQWGVGVRAKETAFTAMMILTVTTIRIDDEDNDVDEDEKDGDDNLENNSDYDGDVCT